MTVKRFIIIIFSMQVVFLASCNSCNNKPEPKKTGIDTLQYEEPLVISGDTTSFIDSLIAVSAQTPAHTDDSAALALKARLMADTFSAKISDTVKNEMREAREYMRQKRNP